MKITIIKWLYRRLNDWEKWELHREIPRPSWEKVLDEQWRLREKLYG